MQIKEYKELAKRTCPDLGEEVNTLHMKMGVMTEIAEAVDAYKKHIAYGKELDLINIQEELADASWYLVNDMTFKGKEFECDDYDPKMILDMLDLSLRKQPEALIRGYNMYEKGEYDNEEMLYFLWTFSEGIGLDFHKGLENNINKLKVRYPEKFDEEKALNRDLESERKELEQ